jgi:hemolysin D
MTASLDLLQRYRDAWRQSWRQRRQMDAPAGRLPHEIQFLPAALALQDKPVHPAPRVFIWSIMAFAMLTVLWASIGKIEVVAIAPGKIVPSGKTKLIQSSETAVVKAIHVSDGQTVRVGERLVELRRPPMPTSNSSRVTCWPHESTAPVARQCSMRSTTANPRIP